jgi:hypothetical protein
LSPFLVPAAPPVEIGFAPVQYTVNEAGAFAVLTIIKRGATVQTVSVDFTTLPDTALGNTICLKFISSFYGTVACSTLVLLVSMAYLSRVEYDQHLK